MPLPVADFNRLVPYLKTCRPNSGEDFRRETAERGAFHTLIGRDGVRAHFDRLRTSTIDAGDESRIFSGGHMAAIVIEFARFVEVRNRRARVAEGFASPLDRPMVAPRDPEADDDRTVKAGVALAADPGGAREGVDVG